MAAVRVGGRPRIARTTLEHPVIQQHRGRGDGRVQRDARLATESSSLCIQNKRSNTSSEKLRSLGSTKIQVFQVFACVRAVFLSVIVNASSPAVENAGRLLTGTPGARQALTLLRCGLRPPGIRLCRARVEWWRSRCGMGAAQGSGPGSPRIG